MNPVIVVLGLVSLFTDLSSNMIVPILPLYLVSVLHVQVQSIGIIEGIAESTASILKLFSGWLSDRVGKYKLLMLMGYGLSNLTKPLFALSGSWGQVLFIRFSDRFGKGIRTSPRDALVAEERGKSVWISPRHGRIRSSPWSVSRIRHAGFVSKQLPPCILVIGDSRGYCGSTDRFFLKSKESRWFQKTSGSSAVRISQSESPFCLVFLGFNAFYGRKFL